MLTQVLYFASEWHVSALEGAAEVLSAGALAPSLPLLAQVSAARSLSPPWLPLGSGDRSVGALAPSLLLLAQVSAAQSLSPSWLPLGSGDKSGSGMGDSRKEARTVNGIMKGLHCRPSSNRPAHRCMHKHRFSIRAVLSALLWGAYII